MLAAVGILAAFPVPIAIAEKGGRRGKLLFRIPHSQNLESSLQEEGGAVDKEGQGGASEAD